MQKYVNAARDWSSLVLELDFAIILSSGFDIAAFFYVGAQIRRDADDFRFRRRAPQKLELWSALRAPRVRGEALTDMATRKET